MPKQALVFSNKNVCIQSPWIEQNKIDIKDRDSTFLILGMINLIFVWLKSYFKIYITSRNLMEKQLAWKCKMDTSLLRLYTIYKRQSFFPYVR